MAGGSIELSGLTKKFTEIAVDNIDLTVASGEFFSLLGPSGCGKTTTLRLIAGFEQPTSGKILLDGVDVSDVPPHRRIVNTVFQSYALFPFLSVWDNVAFGLRHHGVTRAEQSRRVGEALELVKLREYGRRRPGQLSGGQQQRVALARALVLKPAVLLLDEPLGALDLKLRQQLQRELLHIQREVGITFIYVTHDQEEALTMSDRIAVLNHGKIEQIGSPVEVYERPATAFVADFIGVSNIIERDGHQITVRPEKITLLTGDGQPPAQAHVESGTVKDVIYVGVFTRYVIDLEAGGELVVSRQNSEHGGVAAITRGSQVSVAWRADQAFTIPQ